MAERRKYPNLTRDELVLLLNVFFQVEESGEDLTDRHPSVLAASSMLRQLSIHPDFTDDEGFRAPHGLRRRLQDFRRLSRSSEQLEGHSLYHQVWEEFQGDRARLSKEVQSVLRRYAPQTDPNPSDASSPGTIGTSHHPDARLQTRQGWLKDYPTRRAIELRAMQIAVEYYEAKGYAVADTSQTEPYDLECRSGEEAIRIEVKGTIGAGEVVELTRNEVDHAREYRHVHLFVVGQIQITTEGDEPRASGGILVSHIVDWCPSDDDLYATQYRYRVPHVDTE